MTTEQLDKPPLKQPTVSKLLPPWILDFLFVVFLPAVCFALDPVFFDATPTSLPNLFEPLQLATYVCVAILVIAFYSTYIPIASIYVRHFLLGFLLAGLALSLCFGLVLLPLTIIGLVFVLGVLGLIPFGTAWRFWLRIKSMDLGIPRKLPLIIAVLAGFIFPFVPTYFLKEYGKTGATKILSDIQSTDLSVARIGMSNLSGHWYCRKSCQNMVVILYAEGKIALPEPEFAMLFRNHAGIDYKQFLVGAID